MTRRIVTHCFQQPKVKEPMSVKVYRILAIDGGGIRGVIPAVILYRLEKTAGRPIHEMFDLIVGTSTGGIIATTLTAPDGNGRARYSAAEVLELYREHGGEIFNLSWWRRGLLGFGEHVQRIGRVGRWVYEKTRAIRRGHNAKPLEEILRRRLGDAELKDCVTPVVVTSYDIERRDTYFFKTSHARSAAAADRNHYLRDVARATSAGPTFFKPAEISSPPSAAQKTRRVLVDGGVFANNPAMCAWAEAVSEGFEPNQIVLVSIGTGIATEPIPYEKAKRWSSFGWATRIVGVLMDGTADAVHYQLSQLMQGGCDDEACSTEGCEKCGSQRYFRFNAKLKKGAGHMSDVGQIGYLECKAREILASHDGQLARLVELIKPATD